MLTAAYYDSRAKPFCPILPFKGKSDESDGQTQGTTMPPLM
jgi:hypothetical protein